MKAYTVGEIIEQLHRVYDDDQFIATTYWAEPDVIDLVANLNIDIYDVWTEDDTRRVFELIQDSLYHVGPVPNSNDITKFIVARCKEMGYYYEEQE